MAGSDRGLLSVNPYKSRNPQWQGGPVIPGERAGRELARFVLEEEARFLRPLPA
jgi:hypothetical protein